VAIAGENEKKLIMLCSNLFLSKNQYLCTFPPFLTTVQPTNTHATLTTEEIENKLNFAAILYQTNFKKL
jgi:hypothetical protein